MPGVHCARIPWRVLSMFAQWKQPACLRRLKDFFDNLPDIEMQREAGRYLYLHHYGGAGRKAVRSFLSAVRWCSTIDQLLLATCPLQV